MSSVSYLMGKPCFEPCLDFARMWLSLTWLNALDACEIIRRKYPPIKIVILTMTTDPSVAAQAFRRGASGYVLKQCSADELITAVRRVLRGESYLSPMITRNTVEFLSRASVAPTARAALSVRQRQVLQVLAEGKTMKEVAYRLDVQPGTVAFHKYKIMEALDIKTNAVLIEYAAKRHMVAQ